MTLKFNHPNIILMALVLSAAQILGAHNAYAGFEWTPPTQSAPKSKSPATPSVMNNPNIQNQLHDIESMRRKAMEPNRSHTIKSGPQIPALLRHNNHNTAKTHSNQSFEIVHGFGRDIPMILAMSQIIPPQYAYSFADGINPATTISWTGGTSWDVALQDAVGSHGYDISIIGKTVRIEHKKKHLNQPRIQNPVTAPQTTQGPLAYIADTASNNQTDLMSKKSKRYDVTKFLKSGAEQSTQKMQAIEVAEPVAVPPMDHKPVTHSVETWVAHAGESLHEIIQSWSLKSGTTLIWQSNYDYIIPRPIRVNDTYINAIQHALNLYKQSQFQPHGELYMGDVDGPVLLITNK